MDFKYFLELVNQAYKNEWEDKLYQRWLALYPYMETGQCKFIGFEEYKSKLTKTGVVKEDSEEDVLERIRYAERVRKADKRLGGES